MRNMTEESGKVLGRDAEVPAATAADFRRILGDLKELRNITFPRSIKPAEVEGETMGQPMLMVFGDGSREASCALASVSYTHLTLPTIYSV